MKFMTILIIATGLSIASSRGLCAEAPRQISIRVVDEQGEAVGGARVEALYQETVRQGDKVYRVPLSLAPMETTDTNGRCKLTLRDVSWSLAGLHASRVELTSDEAMKLCDDAPMDPLEREAFDRDLDDRCQRFSSTYRVLTPEMGNDALITLELVKAVKIAGRVRVNGIPIAKAFVTFQTPKKQIDQLFASSAPQITDHEGMFSFYTFPHDFDRARIVVERATGNRVLTLSDIRYDPTSKEVKIDFDTQAKDYELVSKP